MRLFSVAAGRVWLLLLVLLCLAAIARADLSAEVTLTNTTGEDKIDWPVILTVWKVFGPGAPSGDSFPASASQTAGQGADAQNVRPARGPGSYPPTAANFHVIAADGREVPHMLRTIPPEYSVGNDEIIFMVPKLAAGQSAKYRITHDDKPGKPVKIYLAGSAGNLLPSPTTAGTPNGDGAYELKTTGGATVRCVGIAVPAPFAADRKALTLVVALPKGSSFTLRSAKPVLFKKDVPYHFSIWGKTENVAYGGYGFWGGGVTVKFDPPALRGRSELSMRGDRDWFCYAFEPGGQDAWGIPDMAARATTEMVRKGNQDVPAELWAKAGGKAQFVITANQLAQPFLKVAPALPAGFGLEEPLGDKSGRVHLRDLLLLEQPEVKVDRAGALKPLLRNGAMVFSRPVDAPRWGPGPAEAAERLDAFAMRGERRQVRFGLYAAEALNGVSVSVSPLKGPAGELSAERLELETLGHYVEPCKDLPALAAGKWAEWLLAFDVPVDAKPGAYAGKVSLRAGGKVLTELPVRLEVLPIDLPDMAGYWVGGIYNTGMGLDRNEAFYREYGKARFNYLMLFDYLVGGIKGDKLDFEAADRQVRQIVETARVADGIGLYREPNMSEDQPRKFYQIASGQPEWKGKYAAGTDAKFKSGYQGLCRKLDAHARAAGWPELVYMVSDEPGDRRDVRASMGWLNDALAKAVTVADVQFADMVRTWDWYNLPVLDDPTDWTGPLVYEYVKARKGRFGFCGTAWAFDTARYQPGLMLPATGACYWHFWHTGGPFRKKDGRVERMHNVAAMAAGVNDLRYYLALKQRLDAADQSKPAGRDARASAMQEAKRFLEESLKLFPGDHDRHLIPYNGVPWQWGDEGFYDRWRAAAKDHILAPEERP